MQQTQPTAGCSCDRVSRWGITSYLLILFQEVAALKVVPLCWPPPKPLHTWQFIQRTRKLWGRKCLWVRNGVRLTASGKMVTTLTFVC